MAPGDPLPSLAALHRPDATAAELEGVAWPGRVLAARWDAQGLSPAEDDGDIGEDRDGIWARQHPEMLLTAEPALARVVARYRRTGLVDITAEDDRTLSAWELAVRGLIAQAHHRAVRSRVRSREED